MGCLKEKKTQRLIQSEGDKFYTRLADTKHTICCSEISGEPKILEYFLLGVLFNKGIHFLFQIVHVYHGHAVLDVLVVGWLGAEHLLVDDR